MPITTYMTDQEATAYRESCAADTELGPLLREIREKTGEVWVCSAHTLRKGRWRKGHTYYSLYKSLGFPDILPGVLEYQIMNFYQDDTGTSINTLVPKACVMAYLFGYLGGIEHHQRQGVEVALLKQKRP